MKYLIFSVLLLAITLSCTKQINRPCIDSIALQPHNITGEFLLKYYVVEPDIEHGKLRNVRFTPEDSDLLTASIDLNRDGINDYIGAIYHFHYHKDGRYPLYSFVKEGSSYHPSKPIYIKSFRYKYHNGELTIDDTVFIYDNVKKEIVPK